MFSAITLKIAGIAMLLGMVGYLRRHRSPRTAVFFISFMIIGLAIWLLASTYELAQQGQAHTVSRDSTTLSRVGRKAEYTFSFWFHAILGMFLLIVGCLGAIASFVVKNVRFNR